MRGYRSTLDLPLRTKLLVGFLAVALIGGMLTVIAGSFLIDDMVVREAQRRVELGLKTAHSMLQARVDEARKACSILAGWVSSQPDTYSSAAAHSALLEMREKHGFDFIQIVDPDRKLIASACGHVEGLKVVDSPFIRKSLRDRAPVSGIRLMPLRQLAVDCEKLAQHARVCVVPTPRAKPGGIEDLDEAMVIEAAAPIISPSGDLLGVVRAGMVLNRNHDLVDFIRDNVFTVAKYHDKNLGTVTIFQHDVRIATNVIDPAGRRAIGTRVSEEVHDKVLGEGGKWIAPAFVVDSWYISAYQPIPGPQNKRIGILYVGVLQDRYDDMGRQAMAIFLSIALLALVAAAVVGTWLAGRLARPIVNLTGGAVEIARGNLDYRLPHPVRAQCDEMKRLTVAFNEMVAALKKRDRDLRDSRDKLERVAEELKRWNQNYLDTLEFITHELKNQVAAMKINLLAVRDGYVGDITDDQKEALDDVVVAVNRTEEMILNYLNLARIEKGDLAVRDRPVHVENDIVQPVLRDVRSRLEEKGMRIEVELPRDLVAQADPSLLQTVYENLLSNAAKYGAPGGLVRIFGDRSDTQVELHVWNEGSGVPPDQVGDLFQKFSRLQSPGEQERGTGLGLFITREIVRNHDGDIRAESKHGEWIDFIFTLPRPESMLEDTIG